MFQPEELAEIFDNARDYSRTERLLAQIAWNEGLGHGKTLESYLRIKLGYVEQAFRQVEDPAAIALLNVEKKAIEEWLQCR